MRVFSEGRTLEVKSKYESKIKYFNDKFKDDGLDWNFECMYTPFSI
jgi:hypothetical protein